MSDALLAQSAFSEESGSALVIDSKSGSVTGYVGPTGGDSHTTSSVTFTIPAGALKARIIVNNAYITYSVANGTISWVNSSAYIKISGAGSYSGSSVKLSNNLSSTLPGFDYTFTPSSTTLNLFIYASVYSAGTGHANVVCNNLSAILRYVEITV